MKKIISSILSIFITFSLSAQTVLNSEVQKKITKSVFEILVEKHEDTDIIYEKELPFENLDFSIRNDKYYPIGTGFLLDDGKFYSACHVFSVLNESIYKDYFIRDCDGNVYKIEDITALSTRRDFISFTVPEYTPQKGAGLKIHKKIEMNSNVFSVGNALGEGIIIRNGILTSQTFESQNGEWKWLRFSAAASPGNSGGPLITENGEVLGIITMKSENENLNYALPMSELKNVKENITEVKETYFYVLPNMSQRKEKIVFEKEIKLPAKYSVLKEELVKSLQETIKSTVQKMRNLYEPAKEQGFAQSSDKHYFFFDSNHSSFPCTIYLENKTNWNLGYSKLSSKKLDKNGNVDFCNMFGYDCLYITKPDDVPLQKLLSNPELYNSYILKATELSRSIGSDSIMIKSFGKPFKTEQYVDYFGRTWFINYYDINFADSVFITFALPLPKGLYVMSAAKNRHEILTNTYLDMQFIADHVSVNYTATYKQWNEYINLPKELTGERSEFLKDIEIKMDDEKLKIKINDMGINLPKKEMYTDEETYISIAFIYKMLNDKVNLYPNSIIVSTDSKKDTYRYVSLKKLFKPLEDAPKNYQDSFSQLVNKITPYDANPYNHEKYTYLDKSAYTKGITDDNKDDSTAIYLLSFEMLGQNKFEEITDFSKKIEELIEIN